MRVTVAVGTRPEVIKIAPVVAALRAIDVGIRVIHTGQHTNATLAQDLELECGLHVDDRWTLPEPAGARLASIFEQSLNEFASVPTDAAIVLGDTWTVPLIALAARSHHVPVVHVEAGLRSGNQCSQEEVNRKMVATVASLHLAPTEWAAAELRNEGIGQDSIVVTGNPATDALLATAIERTPHAKRNGVLFTAHRASNVDHEEVLCEIVNTVEQLATNIGEVTFPVHPRTHDRLIRFGLMPRACNAARVVDPLPYKALLTQLASSALAVTDSGGLQEEAAWFAVPTVVMRATTPRPEGVTLGFARLAGVDSIRVLEHARELTSAHALAKIEGMACPYGDGYTAPRIASAVKTAISSGRLRLREPDLVETFPLQQAMDAA